MAKDPVPCASCRPVRAKPGSEDKIKEMEMRRKLGLPLAHPADATLQPGDALTGEHAGGEFFATALLREMAGGEIVTTEVKPERHGRHRSAEERAKASTPERRADEAARKRLERQLKKRERVVA